MEFVMRDQKPEAMTDIRRRRLRPISNDKTEIPAPSRGVMSI